MLTGRIGYRMGWFGKIIVQVEHDRLAYPPGHSGMFWEDATVNQLIRVLEIQSSRNAALLPQANSTKE